jgi:hypothetical protein
MTVAGKPGPIAAASACRRKFFHPARLNKAPIAIQRSSAWMLCSPLDRDINGKTPQVRVCVRNERSLPLGLPSLTTSTRRAGSPILARIRHHLAKRIADPLHAPTLPIRLVESSQTRLRAGSRERSLFKNVCRSPGRRSLACARRGSS